MQGLSILRYLVRFEWFYFIKIKILKSQTKIWKFEKINLGRGRQFHSSPPGAKLPSYATGQSQAWMKEEGDAKSSFL